MALSFVDTGARGAFLFMQFICYSLTVELLFMRHGKFPLNRTGDC